MIHFTRDSRGCKRIHQGPLPPHSNDGLVPGRVPRIAKLVALALHFDELVRTGKIASYAEIAHRGFVSRARMSQIMNLLHLAPDILEEILFMPRITRGRDPITEHALRKILESMLWTEQRRSWQALKRR